MLILQVILLDCSRRREWLCWRKMQSSLSSDDYDELYQQLEGSAMLLPKDRRPEVVADDLKAAEASSLDVARVPRSSWSLLCCD